MTQFIWKYKQTDSTDIEKISKLTGWKPKVNLESGLKNYISSEFNELIN